MWSGTSTRSILLMTKVTNKFTREIRHRKSTSTIWHFVAIRLIYRNIWFVLLSEHHPRISCITTSIQLTLLAIYNKPI